MKTTFNTKRQYTDEGQVIHITSIRLTDWDDEHCAPHLVHFADVSRGISGEFRLVFDEGYSSSELQERLLEAYDRGGYRDLDRAEEQAVLNAVTA